LNAGSRDFTNGERPTSHLLSTFFDSDSKGRILNGKQNNRNLEKENLEDKGQNVCWYQAWNEV